MQNLETEKLLLMAKSRLPELKKLLESVSDEWGYEDPIYRFYHQSFKVYYVQVEAFFHARHMLEMICKYAEKLNEAPQFLPSGWATVLYLYELR